MSFALLAIVFVTLIWWAATGLVLLLDGRPRHTFRWSMMGATLVASIGFAALVVFGRDTTPLGAVVAFAAAIGVWGWVEVSFLLGFVTGPRRKACDAGCGGARHFLHGVAAILYHEIAIVAAAAAVLAATWDAPNKTGLWTFLLLWGMRASAKLNLHFGVRNTGAHLMPDHLKRLEAYFAVRPMNAFFPVSMAIAVAVFVLLVERAVAGAGDYETISFAMLAVLMGIAILEHLMLVLPMPQDALWRWWLSGRDPSKAIALSLQPSNADSNNRNTCEKRRGT